MTSDGDAVATPQPRWFEYALGLSIAAAMVAYLAIGDWAVGEGMISSTTHLIGQVIGVVALGAAFVFVAIAYKQDLRAWRASK